MGRIYIDKAIGSDTVEVVDLDGDLPVDEPRGTSPGGYHWLDGIVDGTLVTQLQRLDPWRPTTDPVGPSTHIPLMVSRVNGVRYFLVMDHGTDTAPSGTIDMGQPSNTLDAQVPTGKANEIRAVFGLTVAERNGLRSNSVRSACKWLRWQGTRGKETEFWGWPGKKRFRLWSAAD